MQCSNCDGQHSSFSIPVCRTTLKGRPEIDQGWWCRCCLGQILEYFARAIQDTGFSANRLKAWECLRFLRDLSVHPDTYCESVLQGYEAASRSKAFSQACRQLGLGCAWDPSVEDANRRLVARDGGADWPFGYDEVTYSPKRYVLPRGLAEIVQDFLTHLQIDLTIPPSRPQARYINIASKIGDWQGRTPVQTDQITAQHLVSSALGLPHVDNTILATPSRTTFGSGGKIINKDIEPGIYFGTIQPGGEGIWRRLSGFGGEPSDVIAEQRVRASTYVEILPTDRMFYSEGFIVWDILQEESTVNA